jgi:hypothetical protein
MEAQGQRGNPCKRESRGCEFLPRSLAAPKPDQHVEVGSRNGLVGATRAGAGRNEALDDHHPPPVGIPARTVPSSVAQAAPSQLWITPCGGVQPAAPNNAPAPAVIAIASAPQKVTRHVAASTCAPPARADV